MYLCTRGWRNYNLLLLTLIAQEVAIYLYLLGVAHLFAHNIRELHAELLGLAGVDLARRQLHNDIARCVTCVARKVRADAEHTLDASLARILNLYALLEVQ